MKIKNLLAVSTLLLASTVWSVGLPDDFKEENTGLPSTAKFGTDENGDFRLNKNGQKDYLFDDKDGKSQAFSMNEGENKEAFHARVNAVLNPEDPKDPFGSYKLNADGSKSYTDTINGEVKNFTAFPGEDNDIIDKKRNGTLEAHRNYPEKSNFVNTRDDISGAAQQTGKKIEREVKRIFKF